MVYTTHEKSNHLKLLKLVKTLGKIAFRPESFSEKLCKEIINRRLLRQLILRELKIIDTHRVNSWIDKLVAEGFLSPNPTSERTKYGHIKPSNDTRYFFNRDYCEQFLKTHTYSQSTLENYSEKTSEIT